MITAEEFLKSKGEQDFRLSTSGENLSDLLTEFAEKFKTKAEKWDRLERMVGAFYEDEDGEGDLFDIGEIAAMEFGYL